MLRPLIGLAVVGLGGLFAYYYFADSSGKSQGDKAKDALAHVGDTVRDESMAGAVRVRLGASFGVDAARFLHVHYDNGKAIIYGLLPENVKPEQLTSAAMQIPGVQSVEILTQPRPAFLGAVATTP